MTMYGERVTIDLLQILFSIWGTPTCPSRKRLAGKKNNLRKSMKEPFFDRQQYWNGSFHDHLISVYLYIGTESPHRTIQLYFCSIFFTTQNIFPLKIEMQFQVPFVYEYWWGVAMLLVQIWYDFDWDKSEPGDFSVFGTEQGYLELVICLPKQNF